MKKTRSTDFCADRIDVITNLVVIANAVLKSVHCSHVYGKISTAILIILSSCYSDCLIAIKSLIALFFIVMSHGQTAAMLHLIKDAEFRECPASNTVKHSPFSGCVCVIGGKDDINQIQFNYKSRHLFIFDLIRKASEIKSLCI